MLTVMILCYQQQKVRIQYFACIIFILGIEKRTLIVTGIKVRKYCRWINIIYELESYAYLINRIAIKCRIIQ